MGEVFDKRAFVALRTELSGHRSALPSCLVLAFDLVLLGAAGRLASGRTLLACALATLLITLALLHFYLIHHECVHRAVFARDRYNVLLGELLGFVLVYPFLTRRRSHMLHHAWAGHLERDPTNARARARLGAMSQRQRALLELMWRCWFPFLSLNERVGLWRSALSSTEHARQRARERLSLYLYASGYVLLACACLLVPALSAVATPYLLALFLLSVCEELINLPHHIEANTVSHKLALWEQAEVTHSLASVPFWSGCVLLHFNLHTAHHLFPALPWFHLARAERALKKYGFAQVRAHELTVSMRLRRARFAEVFAPYLR
jgi:acyl-lipid omega-6 desaturase (Delta-12 desaturase)